MRAARTADRRALSGAALPGLFFVLATLPLVAWSDPPTPDSQVGDTVTNPVTGEDATVDEVIQDNEGNNAYVLTSDGDVILTRNQVDDLVYCTEPDDEGNCDVYEVVANETDPDTGYIVSVDLQLVVENPDPDDPEPINTESVVQDKSPELEAAAAENAGSEGDPAFVPPETTAGIINEVAVGQNGSNGGNAYGVRICLPLIGCFNIGKSGSPGGDGATGPEIDRTVGASHGEISSTGDDVDGIKLGSTGGNGGKGGDSFGNIGPYDGGDGGNGGTITLTTEVDITTGGDGARGIFAVSRSGRGGDGGDAIIGSGGGSGGAARAGGPVTVTNTGDINTFGVESHGIYALSVGGAAGSGGDSWGITGEGGSGGIGGTGGPVSITNDGSIHTRGDASHGILAQSIGGTGGNGGDAGGITAFGGGAAAGGKGGTVLVSLGASSAIITEGTYSIGVLAQSIGGSGGDSGSQGGIVSFGSSGGKGSDGDKVTVTTADGSTITTGGASSHGIFAQSVGGGGGSAGGGGGAISMGGSGSVGGDGGDVEVTHDGSVITEGQDARGVFAQSVGGGGGAGGQSGGVFSLGGSGGAGGDGGEVTVTIGETGVVATTGLGSDAVFAQSVGGGGGSGASSGGLASLGGGGDAGGEGGAVEVTNAGTLSTHGAAARVAIPAGWSASAAAAAPPAPAATSR